jgi:hypothetical protein
MDDLFDDMMDVVGGVNKVTYVCFVMDHSGSMDELLKGQKMSKAGSPAELKKKSDIALSNFNEQIQTLKDESDDDMDTVVTIIEFDNKFKTPVKNVLVENVKPIKNYWVGGMTALYDAIALGITKVREKMDADEREDKAALMIIQTDGEENYSTEYNVHEDGQKRLKKLIEELENTGLWTFTFLGEDLDVEIATGLGMSIGNTMAYAGNVDGYKMSSEVTQDSFKKYFQARKLGATQTKNFIDNKDKNAKKEWKKINAKWEAKKDE